MILANKENSNKRQNIILKGSLICFDFLGILSGMLIHILSFGKELNKIKKYLINYINTIAFDINCFFILCNNTSI
jgi:hypothetical protein